MIAIGCKKEDTPITETPLTITKADFAQNFKPAGTPVNRADINIAATPITVPQSGDNQTWDVSSLATTNTFTVTPYITPTNTSFPSATYGFSDNLTFGIGTLSSTPTPITDFYEVNDAGWFSLGYNTTSTAVLSVPTIGGTITYAPQNVIVSSKNPYLNLPVTFGTQNTTANIVRTVSFIANAPAAGVNNTPGQTKATDSVINNIMARGTLTLKNIGKVRVLVNMQTIFEKVNYFLGGAPAPSTLLTTLGLTDGAITKTISYDFYAEGLGRVGRIFINPSNGIVTSAFFRV